MIGNEEFSPVDVKVLIDAHEASWPDHRGAMRIRTCSMCREPVYVYCGVDGCDFQADFAMETPHGRPGTPAPHFRRQP